MAFYNSEDGNNQQMFIVIDIFVLEAKNTEMVKINVVIFNFTLGRRYENLII